MSNYKVPTHSVTFNINCKENSFTVYRRLHGHKTELEVGPTSAPEISATIRNNALIRQSR